MKNAILLLAIMLLSSVSLAYDLSLSGCGNTDLLSADRTTYCNLSISENNVVYMITYYINGGFYKNSGYLEANISNISYTLLDTAYSSSDNITCMAYTLSESCFPDCNTSNYANSITKEVYDSCAYTTTSTVITTSSTSLVTTSTLSNTYTTVTYNTGTLPAMNGGTLPGIGEPGFGGGAIKIFGIAIQSFILICCFLVILIIMCTVKPSWFGILMAVLVGDFIIHIMQLFMIPTSLYFLINALAIINFIRGARQ